MPQASYYTDLSLINTVRSKLLTCTRKRKQERKDFNLRVLIGHASLLDRLLDEYEERVNASHNGNDEVEGYGDNYILSTPKQPHSTILYQPKPRHPDQIHQKQSQRRAPQAVSV
ncbi:hypothetical protein TPHA_0E00400 [Tetrapisispora phaffii CBS 4417]|uniref:Uncharacterized protein n=1 Tax=Tetrapisispora phaffii (strain ATCC 24235 / CBS 4417 / NBRC 1672 / NRRL Y-8282 / UCD 70-5) TaxID=1071381 RepID=G8BTA8_TETPH|nr:hypothetical protein TPHA_0E00400 [Tetrapisispora phaffii CBS 4417]CCE63136.1 hypothetical protein TPHA_0E00400 [Tetrapisispora phaffii CBS 4417]